MKTRCVTAPLPAAECSNQRCLIPACTAPQPRCPPGCPKVRSAELIPEISYMDIHAPPPAATQDLPLYLQERQLYNGPRMSAFMPRPPGTRPIPKRPPGGKWDCKYRTDTFLDTFDCQEQPWRSSMHRAGQPEHSYQKIWRPSFHHQGSMQDTYGKSATRQPSPEWKSTITYIPCAHDYGKPGEWRPSKRILGGSSHHCYSKDWRPSVKVAVPGMDAGDAEKPFRPQVVVKGGPSYNAGKEHTQPNFHPSLRYIPEFYPKRPGWMPSLRYIPEFYPKRLGRMLPARHHVCVKRCPYNQQQTFDHSNKLKRDRKAQEASNDVRIKEIIYSKPPISEPFPPCCDPRTTCQEDKRMKGRFNPAGYVAHFEPKTSCLCSTTKVYKPQRIQHVGPQHHSVEKRNPISGPLAPGNELAPRIRVVGPAPLAPHGKLNENIVDGCFHRFKLEKEPMTEQRSQFATCKPWLRKEIFKETNEAYKENRHHDLSAHPSITKYLYEDRQAVVG